MFIYSSYFGLCWMHSFVITGCRGFHHNIWLEWRPRSGLWHHRTEQELPGVYGGVQVQAAGGCKVRVQGHFLSHNKHMFIELQEAKIRIDDLCLDLALFLTSSLMDHIYYLKWFQEFEFHKKIQLVDHDWNSWIVTLYKCKTWEIFMFHMWRNFFLGGGSQEAM